MSRPRGWVSPIWYTLLDRFLLVSRYGYRTFSCDCPADWTGPTCEIKNIVLNCTKTCLNGGECHKIGDTDSDALDRCLCPKGFAGMRCEHSYQECGTGELMCLHGTQCVAPQGELQPDWTCECKQGQSCQRHQSSVCTSSDVDTSVYRGMTSLMYCINDGVCITYEQQGKR